MALHHAQIEKLSQRWPTGSLAQWPACKQKAKTGASISWDALSVGAETVGTSCVVKALGLRRKGDLASIVWTDEEEGFKEEGLQTGHSGADRRITAETRLPPLRAPGLSALQKKTLSMYSPPGTPRIMRDLGKGQGCRETYLPGCQRPWGKSYKDVQGLIPGTCKCGLAGSGQE